MRHILTLLFAMGISTFSMQAQIPNTATTFYNVKYEGAKGNGVDLDTKFINHAIDEAAKAGGGTVYFPAGNYLCGSIHLKSNITLYLENGATIIAAPADDQDEYDAPEDKISNMYEDFGHRHWHNSLIWGENLHNIAIIGHGRIWGKGLVRSNNGENDQRPNKSISLYLCRNVIIRDISMLHAGWFAILATGLDNLTIDNVMMDTNRDGMDIDCCQNVKISNCSVNSPNDDAIVLKSSYGLGFARATENVTITNCEVSGFDEGSFLDGTYKRINSKSPTGRIKMGTESNGGFKNITISNCVFDYCGGLALETVDGAQLEDVTINNITMRDIVNAPIFLRLGARMRGPAGTPVGSLEGVTISNIVAYNVDSQTGAIISGIPGHDIEDVSLHDINIYYKGGGTKEQAEREVPDFEKDYPEPGSFGTMPSYAFFIRDVDGIQLENINLHLLSSDQRPAFVLDNVENASFRFVTTPAQPGIPNIYIKNAENVNLFHSLGRKDATLKSPSNMKL
ncbi:MAG TPA: glycoside hydrolase family 28 protein [Hanamia sp.]|nr:glycoside hydrolase family 28 protein [Hanamia sp.]